MIKANNPSCITLYGLQQGASLVVVLLLLVIVSLIGAGAAQIALMSERVARNDRDSHIALNAAEAALEDAIRDMTDTTLPDTRARDGFFDGQNAVAFLPGCGTNGRTRGLCDNSLVGGRPAWLAVDFTQTDDNAPTVAFGTFTGRTYTAGSTGVQSALPPRYIIELVPEQAGSRSSTQWVYRVTAMGFGPRRDIQVVVQMIYRWSNT
jgi:type IV pilus assembly protein PilX